MGKRIKRLIAASPHLTAVIIWIMIRLRLAPGLAAALRRRSHKR